jgi:N-acetylmuramoyl-L-alanine amidase CwlA
MPYYVKQMLISKNRPGEPFTKKKGITIHSTANIGATALNHFNYWNNADRQSSVHSIADWIGEDILQLIPENEIAWHTGSWQGNREWLGHEMCETNDPAQFKIVWNKTVWYVADVCIRHNWNVDDNVWSHNGLRSLYPGINHTDPYDYLTRMGKSWKLLCDAIEAEIKRRKAIVPTPPVTPPVTFPVTSDKDIYLSVRCLESKADQVIKDINKLGFACKRLDLA